MAVNAAQIAVGTTSVKITTDPTDRAPQQRIAIRNAGPNTAFLSGTTATTSDYGLLNGSSIEVVLDKGDELHAICNTLENATLHVLETGV